MHCDKRCVCKHKKVGQTPTDGDGGLSGMETADGSSGGEPRREEPKNDGHQAGSVRYLSSQIKMHSMLRQRMEAEGGGWRLHSFPLVT